MNSTTDLQYHVLFVYNCCLLPHI